MEIPTVTFSIHSGQYGFSLVDPKCLRSAPSATTVANPAVGVLKGSRYIVYEEEMVFIRKVDQFYHENHIAGAGIHV